MQDSTFFPNSTTEDPNFLLNALHSKPYLNNNASYGPLNDNLTNKTFQLTDAPNSDKKSLMHGRLLGIVVALVACSICLAGIVNIIYSALALASNSWGCLISPSNIFSATLGPSSASMIILDWIWISVGMWTAIPSFIVGLALHKSKRSRKKGMTAEFNSGLPTEPQNSQNNDINALDVYKIFAFVSIIFCLPICFVVGLIDSILSYYCASTGNVVKFILPVIVLSLAVFQFILILLSWYKCKNAPEAEYQYIGNTFTVYEVFEAQDNQPLITKIPPLRPVVKVPYLVKIPVGIPFTRQKQGNDLRKHRATQQRYYPHQVYGPNFGNMPNTYTHMYLPPTTTYQ